jgi:uncharacterized protein (DUF58 family)
MELDLNKIREFGNLELLAKQMVEGFITGLHRSPYHGFSVEFAEHKLYNTGESTRNIDWKVFAKTDRLYTKKYEEETNLRCKLVIDNSSSMFYPSENKGKITFSVASAASLAYLLHKQRDAVGFTTFSSGIEIDTPLKSTSSHIHKLFLQLSQVLKEEHKGKRTQVANVLHHIAKNVHKRSLIIIFSDMLSEEKDRLEEIFEGLQHLKHNKHEVLLFHVSDHKTELNFDFEDRPYEFIDLESGERTKLQPSQIKQAYINSTKDFYSQIALKCGQLKIDFIEADINKDYTKVLNTYLIKRIKMR